MADTSPLNHLIQIEEVHLLPAFFDRLILPQAVLLEQQTSENPGSVRRWIADPPQWLTYHAHPPPSRPELRDLDDGEREAIELAIHLGIDTILIDEAEGRRYARSLHLEVRGTLGLLEEGARIGMTDLRLALDKLQSTNFRISHPLRLAMLQRLTQPLP